MDPQTAHRHHSVHSSNENWDGKRNAEPEAPRHVAQFGIVFNGSRHRARFERHAANGARAGARANDLRVHRACVLGARGGDRNRRLKRHAAGGAGSGFGLAHFGTHWADIGNLASGFRLSAFGPGLRSGSDRWLRRDRSFRRRPSGLSGLVQIFLRIGFEFFRAGSTTKVVLLSGMLVEMLGLGGIHTHPANGVTLG